MSKNKYYFCDELNNTLSCFHNKIMSCCSGTDGPVYIDNYTGGEIDWNIFKKIKEQSFELLTEENINKSPCKDCYYLREKKADDVIFSKFNKIHISHWIHCNCGCIYCARMNYSKGKIENQIRNSDYYDMLPLLKQLYKQELLDREKLYVTVQGGDISVLKEFDPLIKEFLEQGVNEFYILSNNITYQPIIKTLLDMNKTYFVTSLDSGTRELYYKLKQVDKFDDSVGNLKKYLSSKHPDRIIVKYIVIKNFNDNTEAVTNFLNLMSEIGVKKVDFMIDNRYINDWGIGEIPQPPSHYGEIYLHFKKLCEEKNIQLLVWDKLQTLIENKLLINEHK